MTDDLAFNGYVDNRPGLGSTYPRMMYKAGGSEKLHGFDVMTAIVASEDEEAVALSEGWAHTPTLAHRPAVPAVKVPDERDAEIAALRAQLADRDAPRRGRPRAQGQAPDGTQEGIATPTEPQ